MKEPDTSAGPHRSPQSRSAPRLALRIALGVCVAGALAMVFLPIGWQINRFIVWLYYAGRSIGVPDFVKLEWYDFALNVLLFAVPILLAALNWPRVRLWIWPTAGLAGSLAIELIQYFFLPREFSFVDIAANTLGAILAAAFVAAIEINSNRKKI